MVHLPQEVIFKAGDLMQMYPSDLIYVFKTKRKLLPKPSVPQRVISRDNHSYKTGDAGNFPNCRRVRFAARKGTVLEKRNSDRRVASAARSGNMKPKLMEMLVRSRTWLFRRSRWIRAQRFHGLTWMRVLFDA